MCTYKGLVDSINQINATQEKGQKIEKHKSRVPLNLFYTVQFANASLLFHIQPSSSKITTGMTSSSHPPLFLIIN